MKITIEGKPGEGKNQYAIDKIAEEIVATGRQPSGDAVLVALANKLGERIAAVENRHDRRLLQAKVHKLIENATLSAVTKRN